MYFSSGNIAAGNTLGPDHKFDGNHAPASDATSISSGTDSDAEENLHAPPNAKKAELVHSASTMSQTAMPLQLPVLVLQQQPVSVPMSMGVGQQYVSVSLQPAAQHRGYDDLCGDDDDDDMISFRDGLKRKRN